MGIIRYIATADAEITNAYKSDLELGQQAQIWVLPTQWAYFHYMVGNEFKCRAGSCIVAI